MKELELALKYTFKNRDLLRQALTHRSFSNETTNDSNNNEKLEFLGDAVLDLVIAELLISHFPNSKEGDLSKYRAYLVNEGALASQAMGLSLSEYLKLGKSERIGQGELKPRLLGSALEAIIGAIYLDGGLDATKTFINSIFRLEISSLGESAKVLDYKTELQELIQSKMRKTPTYEIVKEEGPSHERMFTTVLKVDSEVMAQGTGKSKKIAEQEAAQIYFKKLQAAEIEADKATIKKHNANKEAAVSRKGN